MFIGLIFGGSSVMKYVSLSNQPCQPLPTFTDTTYNKLFYDLPNVSVNNCDGSCNPIDDPYVKICVPK